MMKHLQKLGRALMLPVAALPVAAILMGIGYWIDPVGWGANSAISALLIKSGGALIDNMGILFAVGVAAGLSDKNDGTGAMAGLVSWLVFQTILATGTVSMLSGTPVEEVNVAFSKINSQFFGILSGVIGGMTYNKFKDTKLPDFLSFFSGKRSVAIVTTIVTLLASLVLFFVWPVIYTALVAFGEGIISLGAVGAGIYAFFNRLLIPTGLHHALNSVFWFDVAEISDIGRFWGGDLLPQLINGTSVTGIYMTGFFPVMMFGLPGGALAMYHTAKDKNKKAVVGLLAAAALASFFTGVTEPMEFAFMFLAPGLYFAHALLTGAFVTIAAMLPVRAGFNFSAGFVDWFLSFKAPGAVNPWIIIPLGIAAFAVYYLVFRFAIEKWNILTPGRGEDMEEVEETTDSKSNTNHEYEDIARLILDGLGGADNIKDVDYCVTRLRLNVNDDSIIDEATIKRAKTAGVVKVGKNSIQVVVGPQVQFVAEEFKKLIK